jgi:WD40 repeat protein
LRESNPRWATIFDRLDAQKTGLLPFDEVSRGFRQILGAGSEVPRRHFEKVFAEIDSSKTQENSGVFNFRQFCELSHRVSQHMMDHPRWAAEEAAADAEDERQRQLLEKERKAKEGPDVFAVLGLCKSKDLKEVEARKRKALSNAHTSLEARRQSGISLAGASIVRSSSQAGLVSDSRPGTAPQAYPGDVRRTVSNAVGADKIVRRQMSRGAFAANAPYLVPGLKRGNATIDAVDDVAHLIHGFGSAELEVSSDKALGPPVVSRSGSKTASECAYREPPESTKIRETWDRWSLATPRGTAPRILANARQILLPEYLPQLRALGRRSAGCFKLSFSPDGSQLAGGFFDGGVRVFDVDGGTQVHCMNLPAWKGGTVRLLEDKKRDAEREAALSTPDYSQFYKDMDEPDLESIVKTWEPVTNLRWRPGGGKASVLATVDTRGMLSLWDVPRLKQANASRCLGQVDTGDPLHAVCFSADGASVCCGGNGKVVHVYDIESETGKMTFCDVEKKPQGRTLGSSHCFRGKCEGHALRVVSLCAHPEKPELIISAGLDRHVLLWDIRASGDHPSGCIYGPELLGDAVDINRDGNSLLVGSHRSKNPIQIFDIRKLHDPTLEDEDTPVTSYSWRGNEDRAEGAGQYTSSLIFSVGWDAWESKTIVAAGENENLARVYDRSTADPEEPLRVIGTLRGKEQAFWSSAVSTDGRNVAVGSADGAVCIMDVERK